MRILGIIGYRRHIAGITQAYRRHIAGIQKKRVLGAESREETGNRGVVSRKGGEFRGFLRGIKYLF